MDRVVTQTRDQAFQTIVQTFQNLSQAFDFLLRPQNLEQLFERLGLMF